MLRVGWTRVRLGLPKTSWMAATVDDSNDYGDDGLRDVERTDLSIPIVYSLWPESFLVCKLGFGIIYQNDFLDGIDCRRLIEEEKSEGCREKN